MDTGAVQNKIDDATLLLKSKNKELVDPLNEFVSGCESVAAAYTTLADAYEKDSESWAKLVNELLDCVNKTVPVDAVDFEKLTKAIEEMKLDVKEDAKNNLAAAADKMKPIQELINGMSKKISDLDAKAKEECSNKVETPRVLENTTDYDQDTSYGLQSMGAQDGTYPGDTAYTNAMMGGAKEVKKRIKKNRNKKSRKTKGRK